MIACMVRRRPAIFFSLFVCTLALVVVPSVSEGASIITTPAVSQAVNKATTQKALGVISPTLAQLGGGDSNFIGPYTYASCNPFDPSLSAPARAALLAKPRPCWFGSMSATKVIVLVGDSHAGMWTPAFRALASSYGFKIANFVYSACPPVITNLDAPPKIYSGQLSNSKDCQTWNKNLGPQINTLKPAAVFFGNGREFSIAPADVFAKWNAGFVALIKTIKIPRKFLIGSTPFVVTPPQRWQCAASHATAVDECAIKFNPSDSADVSAAQLRSDQIIATQSGAELLDVSNMFCGKDNPKLWSCPAVIGGKIVYVHGAHVTSDYMTFIAPAFRPVFSRIFP